MKLDCIRCGYNFIKNNNILPDDFWQDDLHLNNSGKGKLLNNSLVSLNKNYFFEETFYSVNTNRVGYERVDLHTVMKTLSLLRVTLFPAHSRVLNTTIFLMLKLDLEK